MATLAHSAAATSLAGRMTQLIDGLKDEARRYQAYRRTYAELNALPTDSLLDLDLDRGELKRMARKAVCQH